MSYITTKLKLNQISPAPPSNNDVVDLSSAQDITGDKTFNHTIKINADSGYNTGFALINISSERNQRMISGYAGNMEAIIGSVYWNKNFTNNNNRVGLRATKDDGGSYADLYVSINPDGTPITYAPTPSTSDNSTKIATTAYVKSNLSDYLPLSGGTISGNFVTSKLNIDGDGTYTNPFNWTVGGLINGTTPSSNKYATINIKDSSGYRCSWFEYGYLTSGRSHVSMAVASKASGTAISSSILLGINGDGSIFTSAPTPSTTSNDTNIATTAFVKSAMSTWTWVTLTPVTTYCSSVGGNYMSCYQNPYLKLCTVGFNIQLAAVAIPSGTAIVTGFPKAIHDTGLVCMDSSGVGIRMYISATGCLALDGAKTLSASTWVNGSVTYPYSSL